MGELGARRRSLFIYLGILLAGLAAVGVVVAASDAEDPYQVACKGDMNSQSTFEYEDDKVSVLPTPDEAVVSSDLWEFEDIPEDAWRIVDSLEDDGILPIDPESDQVVTEGESVGFRDYAVRLDGETRLLVRVEPVGDGFRITGTVGC
jgi:hypothetical protein